MPEDCDSSDLIDKFLEGGIVALLEHPEVRSTCQETVRGFGLRPPTDRIAVWLMVQLVGYGQGLASEWVKNRLVSLTSRFPRLRSFIEKLMEIEAECQDKAALRQHLLGELSGQQTAPPVADYSSNDETLSYLWQRQRFETLDQAISDGLASVADEFRMCFADLYEPVLSNKKSEARAARIEADQGRVSSSLVYVAEQDAFVGREADLDFLHRFIGTPDAVTGSNRFKWQLLYGEAGDGKSRLGLEFMRQATDRGWNAGFLTRSELVREDFQLSRWQPRMRTLLIVDYPAEEPDKLAELIRSCAEHVDSFHFAVRILLIERTKSGRWFELLDGADSSSAMIRVSRFHEPKQLQPISRQALCDLMRKRFDSARKPCPSDDQLWAQLIALDDRMRVNSEGTAVAAPRPLFAAALAEFLVSST